MKKAKKTIQKVNTEEAVEKVLSRAAALINKNTGVILIPDVVDGYDKEEEKFGFRIENYDWMYGFMAAYIEPKLIKELITKNESIEQYALGHIPAPGTIASDKMAQYDANDPEDVKTIISDFFERTPSGWFVEEYE